MSSLKVVTSSKIIELDESESLNSKITTDGFVTYVLTDTNFSKLKYIEAKLQNNDDISSIQLNK